MVIEDQQIDGTPKPLGLKCTDSDCENGLHCFRQTAKMRRNNIRGACRSCGANLVDWDRIRRHDLADVDYTIEALKHELIRHHFWHVPIDIKAVNYARRKGKIGLKEAAVRRVRSSVASSKHPLEGRQTPFTGNALYYGQHAVAACCRACIEEWHYIPRDRPLTEDEMQYLARLVELYVLQRLPDLTEQGENVSPVRSASRPKPSV